MRGSDRQTLVATHIDVLKLLLPALFIFKVLDLHLLELALELLLLASVINVLLVPSVVPWLQGFTLVTRSPIICLMFLGFAALSPDIYVVFVEGMFMT